MFVSNEFIADTWSKYGKPQFGQSIEDWTNTILTLEATNPLAVRDIGDQAFDQFYKGRAGVTRDWFDEATGLGVLKETADMGALERGVAVGRAQIERAWPGFVQRIENLVTGEDERADPDEEATQRMQQLQAFSVGRIEDVDSVSTFGSWVGENLGQFLPQLGTAAAGGAAGAVAGIPAGPAGVAAGAAWGTRLGFMGTSIAVNTQDAYDNQEEDQKSDARALGAGAIMSLLDLVGFNIAAKPLFRMAVARKMGKKASDPAVDEAVKGAQRTLKNAAKRVGKTGGLGFLGEGTTETLQEVISKAQSRSDWGGVDWDDPELVSDLVNAFAAGGLVGGTFGTVAAAVAETVPAVARRRGGDQGEPETQTQPPPPEGAAPAEPERPRPYADPDLPEPGPEAPPPDTADTAAPDFSPDRTVDQIVIDKDVQDGTRTQLDPGGLETGDTVMMNLRPSGRNVVATVTTDDAGNATFRDGRGDVLATRSAEAPEDFQHGVYSVLQGEEPERSDAQKKLDDYGARTAAVMARLETNPANADDGRKLRSLRNADEFYRLPENQQKGIEDALARHDEALARAESEAGQEGGAASPDATAADTAPAGPAEPEDGAAADTAAAAVSGDEDAAGGVEADRPTYDEFKAALPVDESGDPDIAGAGAAAIEAEAGVATHWGGLSPEQQQGVIERLKARQSAEDAAAEETPTETEEEPSGAVHGGETAAPEGEETAETGQTGESAPLEAEAPGATAALDELRPLEIAEAQKRGLTEEEAERSFADRWPRYVVREGKDGTAHWYDRHTNTRGNFVKPQWARVQAQERNARAVESALEAHRARSTEAESLPPNPYAGRTQAEIDESRQGAIEENEGTGEIDEILRGDPDGMFGGPYQPWTAPEPLPDRTDDEQTAEPAGGAALAAGDEAGGSGAEASPAQLEPIGSVTEGLQAIERLEADRRREESGVYLSKEDSQRQKAAVERINEQIAEMEAALDALPVEAWRAWASEPLPANKEFDRLPKALREALVDHDFTREYDANRLTVPNLAAERSAHKKGIITPHPENEVTEKGREAADYLKSRISRTLEGVAIEAYGFSGPVPKIDTDSSRGAEKPGDVMIGTAKDGSEWYTNGKILVRGEVPKGHRSIPSINDDDKGRLKEGSIDAVLPEGWEDMPAVKPVAVRQLKNALSLRFDNGSVADSAYWRFIEREIPGAEWRQADPQDGKYAIVKDGELAAVVMGLSHRGDMTRAERALMPAETESAAAPAGPSTPAVERADGEGEGRAEPPPSQPNEGWRQMAGWQERPSDAAGVAELRTRVREIAGRMLPKGARMRLVDRLPEDAAGRFRMEAETLRPVIEIAMSADPLAAIHHEAWHAFRELGLISPREMKMFSDLAKRQGWAEQYDIAARYPEYAPESVEALDEAIGDRFGQWAKGQERVPAPIRSIFERIVRFLSDVVSALRMEGYFPSIAAARTFMDLRTGRRARQEPDPTADPTMDMPLAETPDAALLEWFRDSKVTNDDGSPKIVYHGTGSDFAIFESSYGFYFTDRVGYAERYAERAGRHGGAPAMMPVYLSIQNPKRIVRHETKTGYSGREHQFPKDIERAKAEGHDGVEIVYVKTRFSPEHRVWVAFEPTQIKSAIGNQGTFDPANPDIRYARAQAQPDTYEQTIREAAESAGIENAEEVAAEMAEATKGAKQGAKASLKEFGIKQWRRISRKWETLPDNAANAQLHSELNRLQAADAVALRKTERFLKNFTEGLTPDENKLLTSAFLMRDLIWTADHDMKIPFGLENATPQQLQDMLTAIEAKIADAGRLEMAREGKIAPSLEPDRLVARYAMHYQMLSEVRAEIIAEGVLPEARMKNQFYFMHRVLEFESLERRQGGGRKIASPFTHRRKGSELPINLNYQQVWSKFLHKAHTDIATARFLNWFRQSKYNKLPLYQDLAREQNLRKLGDVLHAFTASVSPELAAEIERFKGRPRAYAREAMKAVKQRPIDPENAGDFEKVIRYARYGQDIARGIALIRKVIAGNPDFYRDMVPSAYVRVVDSILHDNRSVNDEVGANQFFRFLSWLVEDAEPQFESLKASAASILMSTNARRRFEIDELEGDFVDPLDAEAVLKAFGEEGEVTWQPDSYDGKTLRVNMFLAKTLPERTFDLMLKRIEKVMADQLDQDQQIAVAEVARFLTKMDTNLVKGGPAEQLIVHSDVSGALDAFRDAPIETVIGQLAANGTRYWKIWMLFQPKRFVQYMLNNQFSDMGAMAATGWGPRIAKEMPQAVKEIAAYTRGKENPATMPLLEKAEKDGVFWSSLGAQELAEIGQRESLKTAQGVLRGAGSWYFNKARMVALARDNAHRYATYRALHRALVEEGRDPLDIGYGATPPTIIHALKGEPERLAARMAIDAMGDYNVSQTGRFLRSRVMPFGSWLESNTRRYIQFIANLPQYSAHMGMKRGLAMGAVAGARALIWLHFGAGAAWVWNNVLMEEDEDKLSPSERARPHVTLGSIGDTVYKVNLYGAFSDFAMWGNLPEATIAAEEVAAGRAGFGDLAFTIARGPVQRVLDAINPFYKGAAELIFQQQMWPDWYRPRRITGNLRFLTHSLALGDAYPLIARAFGEPAASRDVSKILLQFGGVRELDVQEQAYLSIRSKGYAFREKIGGKSPGGSRTRTGELMFFWKYAVRQDEPELARQAYDMLEEEVDRLGGKPAAARVKASLRTSRPLGMLSVAQRKEFRKTLSAQEQADLRTAQRWFAETYNRALTRLD